MMRHATRLFRFRNAATTILAGICACAVPLAVSQQGQLSVTPTQISTLAGNGLNLNPGQGDFGPASAATFNSAKQVVTNAAGDVYIADGGNQEVRVIYNGGATTATLIQAENPGVTPVPGNIYPIAGILGNSGTPTNGSLAYGYSHMNTPQGLALDQDGNVYIADGSSKLWVIFVGGAYVTNLITIENAAQPPVNRIPAAIPPLCRQRGTYLLDRGHRFLRLQWR